MKILVIGTNGRMGKQVCQICKNKNIDFVGVDVSGKNCKTIFDDECKQVDFAIDFSSANAIKNNLEFCKKNKINLVVATTGHSQENLKLIDKAKNKIAIFVAPNLSIGFNRFLNMVQCFDNKDYDVAIVEQHHKNKKDNPSGSAKQLECVLQKNHKDVQIFGIRGGTEIGTHTVIFYGESEKITITHQAENRDIFAFGAIKAGEFIQTKCKGIYTMKNLVDYEK